MQLSNLPVRAHLWYAGQGPRQFAFLLARLHPHVRTLERTDNCWRVQTTSDTFYVSDPRQITRVAGIGVNMSGRVIPKYTLPGFVAVENGDTVVDVGAFIGEFARSAGEIGDRVIAVEPDERNAAALRRNLEHLPGSEVVQKAAWRETGQRSFQVARDSSEGSILNVDSDDVTEVVTLDTVSIADLAADADVGEIDYLKVEAEGAEPEVLEGIGDISVRKVAVECAPERDGETPAEEVTEWLQDRGYSVRKRDHIVFARE